jgi:hypothetical protein
MAAGDYTTTAALKLWLGITNGTDDALLADLITNESAYFNDAINRPEGLAVANYTERASGNGKNRLVLRYYPVTAVTSLMISGQVIPQSPDGIQSGYMFDEYGLWLIGYSFTKGVLNVSVLYAAGYSTVPVDVGQAVKELCALRMRERGWIGQVSKALGNGETVTFTTREMQADVDRIVQQYKRRIPISSIAGPAGGFPPVTFSGQHSPVEALDGVRTTFTFLGLPAAPQLYMLVYNGAVITQGFTQAGNQITMSVVPSASDELFAYY